MLKKHYSLLRVIYRQLRLFTFILVLTFTLAHPCKGSEIPAKQIDMRVTGTSFQAVKPFLYFTNKNNQRVTFTFTNGRFKALKSFSKKVESEMKEWDDREEMVELKKFDIIELQKTKKLFLSKPESILTNPHLLASLLFWYSSVKELTSFWDELPHPKFTSNGSANSELILSIKAPRSLEESMSTKVVTADSPEDDPELRAASNSVTLSNFTEPTKEMRYWWTFLKFKELESVIPIRQGAFDDFLYPHRDFIGKLENKVRKKEGVLTREAIVAFNETAQLDQLFASERFQAFASKAIEENNTKNMKAIKKAWARLRKGMAYFNLKPCKASMTFAKKLGPKNDSPKSKKPINVWRIGFERKILNSTHIRIWDASGNIKTEIDFDIQKQIN